MSFEGHRWHRAISVLAVVAVLPALAQYVLSPYVSGDTAIMVGNVRTILHDIGQGHYRGWVGQFPLLQQIPTGIGVSAGLSDTRLIHALVVLNLLALACLTFCGFWSLRRRSSPVAALFVLVILSGPMLWYGHASFNEMLAAALTLGLVISVVEDGAAGVVVIFLVGASLAKDTALPFLVILALGAALSASHPGDAWHRRLRLVPVSAGALLALVIMAGFNYLRFSSVLNTIYFDPMFVVPALDVQVKFFVAIWFSPNGGIVPFWPSLAAFLALAVAAAVIEVRRCGSPQARLLQAAPLLAVSLVLGGMTLGLSKWVAPLGWIAWGPRLMMPWLAAAAYLLASTHHRQIEAMLVAVRRNVAVLAAVAAIGIASLPQFLILFRPGLWDSLFTSDAVCPRIPYIQAGAPYYYRCTVYQLWTKHSILLDAYHPHYDRGAFLLAAACTLAWAWFALVVLVTTPPVIGRRHGNLPVVAARSSR